MKITTNTIIKEIKQKCKIKSLPFQRTKRMAYYYSPTFLL